MTDYATVVIALFAGYVAASWGWWLKYTPEQYAKADAIRGMIAEAVLRIDKADKFVIHPTRARWTGSISVGERRYIMAMMAENDFWKLEAVRKEMGND